MINQFFILMRAEIGVTAILFVLLFIKLAANTRNEILLPIIHLLLLGNLVMGFIPMEGGNLFDGVFRVSPLIIFQKNVLSLGVYLVALLFSDWFKEQENMPEFFILMLSSLLGMFFMISSGDLLIFFLALELASIPIAAMANLNLDKRLSSEAAIKMILSNAFSSGILLFGISLLYGTTGTLKFQELPGLIQGGNLQILLLVFLFTAFAFKLSVVPFHLWTADVYEGAPYATASFLSVVSKASVAFIFMTTLYKVFGAMEQVWYSMLVLLSLCTMIIGNLFALRQKNIKRFLAFSSIAQVGFILVGISGGFLPGTSAVVYFILVYTFSNLAAFAVAALVAQHSGKEQLADYNGLYQTNPMLCWVMALALFSLAGIPPTAGFFGKLFLITAGATKGNYIFILVAALNMIVSLYYYLKVVRAMFMEANETPIERIRIAPPVMLGLMICSMGIILLGFLSWIYDYIQHLQP